MFFYRPEQRFLVLDIETVPTSNPELIDSFRQNLAPPANYKKPESIAEWHRTHGGEALQEKINATALKGTQGDVIAVGWQTFTLLDGVTGPDRNVNVIVRWPEQSPGAFLDLVFAGIRAATPGQGERSPYVIAGHNLVSFDLPFLWQQALRYETKWPEVLPILPPPHEHRVLDTMLGIVGYRNTISLRETARALGIPWEENILSGDVPTAWLRGEDSDVIKHLTNDVTVTAQVAHRIASARLDPDPNPFSDFF
jgi:3'-5' exonuclease